MTPDQPARRDDPFRLLLNVGAALVSSPVAGEALQGVARAIGEAMNVATVDIQAYDREGDCLIEEACWNREGISDEDRTYLGTIIPLAERPSFRPIIAGRQMVEMHIDDPALPRDERESFARWGYKTTLDAPLIIGSEVIGVLGVTETRFVRHFMTMERDRFEQLAGMAAAAIRNARVFRREREQSRRLEALLDIGRALAASDDPDEVFAVAPRLSAEVLGAASADVDLSAGESADGLVSIDVTDPEVDDGVRAEMTARGENTRLIVPLESDGETHGRLTLSWSEKPTLDDGELDFVVAVARQLGAALDEQRLAAALDARRDQE